jgi:predicted RNA binding protein YcfA (HicA-like mRNA interferase family)
LTFQHGQRYLLIGTKAPTPKPRVRRRMRPRRLLRRIVVAPHNVRFRDLLGLAEALGFRVERNEGSHHILVHPDIPELLNLQEVKGEVKPYQVRQLLGLIERYNLGLGDEK